MIAREPRECAPHNMKPAEANRNIEKSGLIRSSQAGTHPNLEKHVRRHLQTPWSQPLHRPTVDVYREFENTAALTTGQPLILDSGCGTGKSTRQLAASYPRHLVIGVDQSIARLAKGGMVSSMLQSANCILLRAELTTLWRLLAKSGLSLERHFILYPNPWPKPGHLSRRWHGHPVFPQLLSLGGEIELRCNWEIYALEFAAAVRIATGEVCGVERIQAESGISLFEKKYMQRGHSLFSVSVPAKATAGFRPACLAN